jgi:hypothetical protein
MRRWSSSLMGVALLVGALLTLLASLLLPTHTAPILKQGDIGPIGTVPGQPKAVALPSGLDGSGARSLDLHFQFRLDLFVDHETLFRIGAVTTGLAAQVTSTNGNNSVTLKTTLRDGSPFTAILVSDVALNHTYRVQISLQSGRDLVARVDGRKELSFSYPNPEIHPSLRGATIGGDVQGALPFQGTISGFSFSYAQMGAEGSNLANVTLRVLAGIALFFGLVLLLLRVTTSRSVLHYLGLAEAPPPRGRSFRRALAAHGAGVGLALLVIGASVLAIITPIDNAVLQRTGDQRVATTGVSDGRLLDSSLSGMLPLFRQASSLDVRLSFQFRISPSGTSARIPTAYVIVSTMDGIHGLSFQLVKMGQQYELLGIAGGGRIQGPVQRTLVGQVPLRRWVTVSVLAQRNQSFIYSVDGEQVQTFTFNSPILNFTPSQLFVDSKFGGAIRDPLMDVSLFQQPPTRVPYLLTRVGQGMAILAIAGGVVLLLRRLLSRLIPVAGNLRRPLLLVTFATMGGGELVSIVVDLFRFQQSPSPYFDRNSWLISQYPRFSDFFQVSEILRSLNPYGLQAGNYPPVGYWLVAPFEWMSNYAALFVFLSIAIGFLVWWLSRTFTSGLPTVERVAVVAVALLSLPITFAVDRGNIDLLVLILVICGVAALERKRHVLSASLLGIAAAAKIFPILFLFVFLRGRRLRFVLLGAGVIVVTSLLAFLGFHGTLVHNLDAFRTTQDLNQTQLGAGVNSTYYNASWPGFVQGVGYAISGDAGANAVQRVILPLVNPVEFVCALLLAGYLYFREQSLWRVLTLIVVTFLLFSDLSNYYALLFLFVPLAAFVKEASVTRSTLIIGTIFGLVLAPRAYFYFGEFVDFSVLTTAPLLLALGIAVIGDGIRDRRSSRTTDPERVGVPALEEISA